MINFYQNRFGGNLFKFVKGLCQKLTGSSILTNKILE